MHAWYFRVMSQSMRHAMPMRHDEFQKSKQAVMLSAPRVSPVDTPASDLHDIRAERAQRDPVPSFVSDSGLQARTAMIVAELEHPCLMDCENFTEVVGRILQTRWIIR